MQTLDIGHLSPRDQKEVVEGLQYLQIQRQVLRAATKTAKKCFKLCVPQPGDQLTKEELECSVACALLFKEAQVHAIMHVQPNSHWQQEQQQVDFDDDE